MINFTYYNLNQFIFTIRIQFINLYSNHVVVSGSTTDNSNQNTAQYTGIILVSLCPFLLSIGVGVRVGILSNIGCACRIFIIHIRVAIHSNGLFFGVDG